MAPSTTTATATVHSGSTSSSVATSSHSSIISTSTAAVGTVINTSMSNVSTVSTSLSTPTASAFGTGNPVSWATSGTITSNSNSLSNTSVSIGNDAYQEANPSFNFASSTQHSVESDNSTAFTSGSSGVTVQANAASCSSSASICSNVTNSSIASTITSNTMALVELRKACINLLLSMLPLPLHFQVNIPISSSVKHKDNFYCYFRSIIFFPSLIEISHFFKYAILQTSESRFCPKFINFSFFFLAFLYFIIIPFTSILIEAEN